MSSKLEFDGEEYTVSGNPSMGTVKYVQSMEIELMRNYLDDETILQINEGNQDELMEKILEDAGVDDFKNMMWERGIQEPLQTICLGIDEELKTEDIDDMKSLDFEKLLTSSREALGGDASDFIERLGIDISSKVNELQEEMETSQTSSPELPPSVSETLRGPSGGNPETEQ